MTRNEQADEIFFGKPKSPYDPKPRTLCPDPVLGTREGWKWCPKCGGIQPSNHVHHEEPDEAN